MEFANQVETIHEIALLGPGGGDVLKELLGEWSPLGLMRSVAGKIDGTDVVIWRDDVCGTPGHFLIVSAQQARALWMGILSRYSQGEVGKRRVRAVGWAVFNTTRIEAGRVLFGIDFDDTVLPAETGQISRAVNFEKGCYLGQEIVARMHARGQAARKIAGIRMKEDALPVAGSPIVEAGEGGGQNQIGAVTSSTISPVLSNAAIGLGLMRSQFAAVGTKVKVAAEGAFREGEIVELPFVKFS